MEHSNIKQDSFGGRMHYLRWHTPNTLRMWGDSNASYDSTLGYADEPGFRCGTCHDYPAFDALKQEEIDIIIRPLIAMEISVISAQYLDLGTGQVALDKFLSLKNECRKVNGNFTLLWHNSRLPDIATKNLYESILKD